MTTIRIKLPTIEQVNFTLNATYEEVQVRGNAMASGDDAGDKAYEDEIIQRLDNGDVWAWALVKVIAEWRGVETFCYCGCCSYEDEKDFMESSNIYEEMKQESYVDLLNKIKALKGKS